MRFVRATPPAVPGLLAFLFLAGGCSSSDPSPCGDGGREFRSDVGAVCAYAVVEGGFTCPTDLPEMFELPSGGRLCAPSGAGPGDLPPEACRYLGHDDCSEADPFDPGGMADGGMSLPDAGLPSDAGGPQECDMLEATAWSGDTPWGAIEAEVVQFDAGDCIGISGAGLELVTTAGDTLWVSFSYPVTGGFGARTVEGTFDREASLTWRPAAGSSDTDTAMIRVEVTTWRERAGDTAGHEIDAIVTFLDARFGTAPLIVRGRFCDWANLLC